MKFFKDMERIIKTMSAEHLKVLEFYNGLDLELHREIKNGYSDVYGRHSGNQSSSLIKRFTGILVSDDFYTADSGYAGNFDEGFLYTSEKDIQVSDVVKIDSSDSKSRRYKVISRESLGMQDEVFVRYKLSNLGD